MTEREPRDGPLTVVARFLTDVGCERQVNEDSVRFFNPGASSRLGDNGMLAVVADGMGGHSAGEVASGLATEAIGSVYFDGGADGDPPARLRRAFAEANRRIYDLAAAQPDKEGMGTTCTALALGGGHAWAAHVGDSRIYLLRGGDLFRMTEDDSVVGQMVREGLISSEEARHHAEKNVILRALGTQPAVEPAVWEQPFALRAGDRFLLSTDGLHDLVADGELSKALAGGEPEKVCSDLVELARSRGGHDNITVGILAMTGGDADRPPRPTREVSLAESKGPE